jgi:cyclopropane-fatty-acyl-phospholipid synthase
MLALIQSRSEAAQASSILVLSDGYGSLALFLAQAFPHAEIYCLTPSKIQEEVLSLRAEKLELRNILTLSSWQQALSPHTHYDLILSIESLQHCIHYSQTLHLLSRNLRPEGRLFLQLMTHPTDTLVFADNSGHHPNPLASYLHRYFLPNAMIPLDALIPTLQNELLLYKSWMIPSQHYLKTVQAWQQNFLLHKNELAHLFTSYYLNQNKKWLARWQLYLSILESLFLGRSTTACHTSQYLFKK